MKKIKERIVCFIIAFVLVLVAPLTFVKVIQAEENNDDSLEAKVSYKVGDIVQFGHYDSDKTTDGEEPIEWQVLKVEPDRILVISKYLLMYSRWSYGSDYTWEKSEVRYKLNEDFYEKHFSTEEQARIPLVTVVNKNNPIDGNNGGNNTEDHIFCLSYEEVETYFGLTPCPNNDLYISKKRTYNPNLMCEIAKIRRTNVGQATTRYQYEERIKAGYKGYSEDNFLGYYESWWLRDIGTKDYPTCYVSRFGDVAYDCYALDGFVFHDVCFIRPAMYIKTVIEPTDIKLDHSDACMYFGDELQLKATLYPSNVDIKDITWSIDNKNVGSVNNGKVKVWGAGKATVTAKTVNGLTAKCNITVFADGINDNIFADIKYGSWQYNSAEAAYYKGYMTGKGDLKGRILFSPDTAITRSQFVVALYSMDGKPTVAYEQKFSDVTSDAWYAKQVTWAANNGIVAGNADGTFGVNGNATREQLALMFYKYAKYKNYDVSVSESTNLDNFKDADKVHSWALEAVKWAVERGIISGKGNAKDGYRIDPSKSASRIECAAMMNKFDEVYSGAKLYVPEEIEDPIAIPAEDVEDIPLPGEEKEDIIDGEDEENNSNDEIEDDVDDENEE